MVAAGEEALPAEQPEAAASAQACYSGRGSAVAEAGKRCEKRQRRYQTSGHEAGPCAAVTDDSTCPCRMCAMAACLAGLCEVQSRKESGNSAYRTEERDQGASELILAHVGHVGRVEACEHLEILEQVGHRKYVIKSRLAQPVRLLLAQLLPEQADVVVRVSAAICCAPAVAAAGPQQPRAMAATHLSLLGSFTCDLYETVTQRLAQSATSGSAFDTHEYVLERGEHVLETSSPPACH